MNTTTIITTTHDIRDAIHAVPSGDWTWDTARDDDGNHLTVVTAGDGTTLTVGLSEELPGNDYDPSAPGADFTYGDGDDEIQGWARTVGELTGVVSRFVTTYAVPESQPCRRCGASVAITRIDGDVQETDGSGDIVCDACWTEQEICFDRGNA